MVQLASVFAGLAVAFWLFGLSLRRRSAALMQSRREHVIGASSKSVSSQPLGERFKSWAIKAPNIGIPSALYAATNPEAALREAGGPYDLSLEDIKGLKTMACISGAITALVLAVVMGLVSQALVFMALGCVLGFFIPDIWLRQMAAKKREEIITALPMVIDLLAILIEAGLGFDVALKRVSERIGGPFGREIDRALKAMEMGASRREALTKFALDSEVHDVEVFVHAVLQGIEHGTPLSAVLQAQSEDMRAKTKFRIEELASKAPIKMLVPLMFLIMPALIIVVLVPPVIGFF